MQRKRIPVDELRFGMYIAELDRPWTDTPFVFQGFVLVTQKDLATLKEYCATVLIDVERGDPPGAGGTAQPVYAEKASVEQEMAPARAAYGGSRALMRDVLSSVRIGRTLDAGQIRAAVNSMAESVLRNPDALLLLSQLRKKGEYHESHALDVSIYMTTFGRFLELDPASIELLGYLGLLQDVGKLRLPKELLDKRGRLSAAEFELARQHVGHTAEILRTTPGLPAMLPRIAALHHERHDGSGYPAKLRGDEIGMLGSIAAIVDTFGALTVQRPYADPVSPSAAISLLYKARAPQATANERYRILGTLEYGSVPFDPDTLFMR